MRGRLRKLANKRRQFGYRRLFVLLRREGELFDINRIYPLYREEGLTARKRKARRKLALWRSGATTTMPSAALISKKPDATQIAPYA